MIHSVNDTPFVSMAKDTDGPTVWSDGPRNKYESGLRSLSVTIVVSVKHVSREGREIGQCLSKTQPHYPNV